MWRDTGGVWGFVRRARRYQCDGGGVFTGNTPPPPLVAQLRIRNPRSRSGPWHAQVQQLSAFVGVGSRSVLHASATTQSDISKKKYQEVRGLDPSEWRRRTTVRTRAIPRVAVKSAHG